MMDKLIRYRVGATSSHKDTRCTFSTCSSHDSSGICYLSARLSEPRPTVPREVQHAAISSPFPRKGYKTRTTYRIGRTGAAVNASLLQLKIDLKLLCPVKSLQVSQGTLVERARFVPPMGSSRFQFEATLVPMVSRDPEPQTWLILLFNRGSPVSHCCHPLPLCLRDGTDIT